MSIKLHFLDSHVVSFQTNSVICPVRRERDVNMKDMEKRYQGTWCVNMMADYCWNLKRDVGINKANRKRHSLRRSFEEKQMHYHKQGDLTWIKHPKGNRSLLCPRRYSLGSTECRFCSEKYPDLKGSQVIRLFGYGIWSFMIYRFKEHSCFKHIEFRGLNAPKSLSHWVMELWGYWVMGFWNSGVWGLWDFGVVGFVLMLLSFIIFSLFFEIRKKIWCDGVNNYLDIGFSFSIVDYI